MSVDFPFHSLKVGEVLQLSPLVSGSDLPKYHVKYMGGVDKKSIICTAPTVNDRTMFVKEYSGFLVQLFCGKNIYRFNTVVDAVLNKPYPHLHLMFPNELIVSRLRKNQRVAVKLIASMRNLTEGEQLNLLQSGRLVDLSLCGAMIETFKQSFQEGSLIECSFKLSLESQDVMLVVKGFVRSVKTAKSSDGKEMFRYGMLFDALPIQEEVVLQNYILRKMTSELALSI